MDERRRLLIALLPELRGYARFLVRGTAEADDLVQETLVRALPALPQLVNGTSLRPWLFAILRNAFFEQARRRRSEHAALQNSPIETGASLPEQHGRVDLTDLQRHLFALPPLLREALVLVGAHGLSYEEAAAICGVPVGTMKARVSRGRAQLARAMAAPFREPEG
ncbi:ECF RNA polymerase sigma factor EcfG [Rhodovastum atsumiense]|uniref:sigma-70 family RNA polymerase sigma factor n=1 Tax=Rhodovastum atsumiense TaxID=504468 RepID=UPI001EF0E7E8|nr:sigma-70 family RNA polymerase sigma factor [Rhodovastum atsumiense]CAH2605005.1 ECF RNA polymerase sigma factor EcfG [Rhodovastum atsumiense]